jgi:predicted nucleic acid-binding protein
MILVDSTLYIAWLRARSDPTVALGEPLRRHEAATCGIVRAEVLRGIVSPVVQPRMAGLFDLMHEIPLDGSLWTEAAELAWTLDRQGVVLPLADLAIAACGRRIGATVVTTDPHFSRIPGLAVRATV